MSQRPVGHRAVLCCLWMALAAGCGSAPPDGETEEQGEYGISGIVIRNELAYPVTDVMINVPATGAFAGCGNILPRTDCRTTFQETRYQRNSLVVSWKEYGQPQQTGEFTLPIPATARPGDSFLVEVTVFAAGQAGARLVRAEPDRLRNR